MNDCSIEEVIALLYHQKLLSSKVASSTKMTMHFCYLTRLGRRISHYTIIEITKDGNVETFFSIYDFINLYVTFKRVAFFNTISTHILLSFTIFSF